MTPRHPNVRIATEYPVYSPSRRRDAYENRAGAGEGEGKGKGKGKGETMNRRKLFGIIAGLFAAPVVAVVPPEIIIKKGTAMGKTECGVGLLTLYENERMARDRAAARLEMLTEENVRRFIFPILTKS